MNRRDVLRSALAGATLTLLPDPLAEALSGVPRRSTNIIYDVRYAEARAFAEHVERNGDVMSPTRGDATGLWYGGQASALLQTGRAVLGVTTWPDLVIARSRGRELGLRLAFEESLLRCFYTTNPTGTAERRSHLLVWLLLPRHPGSARPRQLSTS